MQYIPSIPSANELCNIAENILIAAKKKGASAAELTMNSGQGFSVLVRKGKVDGIEQDYGKELGISVYFGNKSGSAMTSDFHPEALNLTLEKACHIAKFTQEDVCTGLADPELMAYGYPDLDLFHPWSVDIDHALQMAKECEAQAFAYDKRIINSDGCGISSSKAMSLYANTHGFLGTVKSTRQSMAVTLIAEEKGLSQRDGYYTRARDACDLENIAVVARKAAEHTVRRLSPRHLGTCHCPVIFAAEVARSLLSDFIQAISGGHLYRKTSFLLDHLGQRVFPEFIQIDERPLIPKMIGSSPFDGEGVRIQSSNIIQNGILQRYVLDSYTARKLKLTTTGNCGGVFNLFISTSDLDFPALLKKMGTGFLVTDILGDGINLVTGDYSRGAFGFWVENGEIQYPVEGVTVAGNLKDMFQQFIAIGNDIDHRSNIKTGSILLERMVVAGSNR
jgi:PmbA protein